MEILKVENLTKIYGKDMAKVTALDKDQILELYLNTSYFGDGYYTVKEACKGYFNKELKEMTDYECILLAGIPNAPSIYAPSKNPELAKQRQKQVINKMIEYGYLTQNEAENIEILKHVKNLSTLL